MAKQLTKVDLRGIQLENLVRDLLTGVSSWNYETMEGTTILNFTQVNTWKLQDIILKWLTVPERVQIREGYLRRHSDG